MRAKQVKVAILLLYFSCPEAVLAQEAVCLWYRQPATEWMEALPLRITSDGKPIKATSPQAKVVEFETEPAGVYMLSARR